MIKTVRTPKPLKVLLMVAHDGLISGLALYGALWLRFGGNITHQTLPLWALMTGYGLISLWWLWLFGLYRGIWRYTGTNELVRIGEALVMSTLCGVAILVMLTRFEAFPRSALVITFLLQAAFVSGSRVAYRLYRDWRRNRRIPTDKVKHIVVVGANDSSETFIREAARNPRLAYKVVGILDDESAHQGRRIHMVPILGPLGAFGKALKSLEKRGVRVDMLVLTRNTHVSHQGLMGAARQAGISVQRLPDLEDLSSGERITNLKPVHIEDLLGRQPVSLDNPEVATLVQDKVILVTGAGGSIGSELCRQVAANGAKQVLMLDSSEYALYTIDMEMAGTYPNLSRQPLLVDVRDQNAIENVFKTWQPQVVIHAAACKHVPLVEANPLPAMTTNLFGTRTVADAAAAHKAEAMVLISTDKAVNPTNVMGATKRAAEIYCQHLPGPTRFITVRFGNVLGSSGSVVPLFRKQIEAGGPLTVTDKRMTRFFMTIPEAVQLVLRAATIGAGGEIFVLDMGKPVRIWEMAEQMVRLSGLIPHQDIEIKEIGMRPGEKLYEELLHDRETLSPTQMESVLLAHCRTIDKKALTHHLDTIAKACNQGQAAIAVTALAALVPEYTPAENSPYYTLAPH